MEQIDKYLIDDWQKLTAHVKRMAENETPINNSINERQKTALQRLARRYRRFAIMALCCIPASFSFLNPHIYSHLCGVWTFIIYNFVMLCCVTFDWILFKQLSSISEATMPVIEVLKKAMACRKYHLLFIAVFLPLDFLFIGLLIAASDHNFYFSSGIIVGTIAGLSIGIRNLRQFLADYREIFTNDD